MSYQGYRKPFAQGFKNGRSTQYDGRAYPSSVDGRVTPVDSDNVIASKAGFGVKHIVRGVPVYEVLEALPARFMQSLPVFNNTTSGFLATGNITGINNNPTNGQVTISFNAAGATALTAVTTGSLMVAGVGTPSPDTDDIEGYVVSKDSDMIVIQPVNGDWSLAGASANYAFYNKGYTAPNTPVNQRGTYIDAAGGATGGHPTTTIFADAPASKYGL